MTSSHSCAWQGGEAGIGFEFGIGSGDTITLWSADGNTALSTVALPEDGGGKGRVYKLASNSGGGGGGGGQWSYTGTLVNPDPICMNGVVEGKEECDTGVPTDRCRADCTVTPVEFFDDHVVPVVTITIARSEYDSLNSCQQTTEYLVENPPPQCGYHVALCTVSYTAAASSDGRNVPQTHTGANMPCGIRRKGEASWRSMGEKPALKVRLDKRWRGLKRFTFNNMVNNLKPNPKPQFTPTQKNIYKKIIIIIIINIKNIKNKKKKKKKKKNSCNTVPSSVYVLCRSVRLALDLCFNADKSRTSYMFHHHVVTFEGARRKPSTRAALVQALPAGRRSCTPCKPCTGGSWGFIR